MIRSFGGATPQIPSTAYVDASAQVIGDVIVGEHSSVWPNAVIRGDDHYIRIGARVNIQDGCVLHVEGGLYPLVLADNIGVGHQAILHGCTVEPGCLISMGAIVLNNARVGEGSIVAAGAVVPENTVVPPGSLYMGVPARLIRKLGDEDRERIQRNIASYLRLKDQYLSERA